MASLSEEAHRVLEALEHPAVLRHPGLHGNLVDALKAWVHRVEGIEPAPAPVTGTDGGAERPPESEPTGSTSETSAGVSPEGAASHDA